MLNSIYLYLASYRRFAVVVAKDIAASASFRKVVQAVPSGRVLETVSVRARKGSLSLNPNRILLADIVVESE